MHKASAQSGDFHGQVKYENFKKWVLEKLLPNLRPQSVACMDNAPYHTKAEDPTPMKYATKQTMVNWLMRKTIY
ncbi:hypothetical protein X975_02163, partial [Stegodyphus mimosarum]